MKLYYYLAATICSMLIFACGIPAPYPLPYSSSKTADDRIIGKWKMEEDTNKNNFYLISKVSDKYYQYHVEFWNRGGKNRTYEAEIFFSELDSMKFLNIPYYQKRSGKGSFDDWENKGWFFVRILVANEDFTRLTTATVNDARLAAQENPSQMARYMKEHKNDPSTYSDTVHFYQVEP